MSNQPDRVKMYNTFEDFIDSAKGTGTSIVICEFEWNAVADMLDSHALLLAEQAKEIKELKERVKKLEEIKYKAVGVDANNYGQELPVVIWGEKLRD